MQAGRLNRRVTIQHQGASQDDWGQPVTGWVDVASVWADIRMRSGIEAIRAGSPVSVVQASIRIRYRQGVTAGMRVVHGDTTYNITAVQPDESGRQFLDLIAEVVT